MNRYRLPSLLPAVSVVVVALLLLGVAGGAGAQTAPRTAGGGLPNFDVRVDPAGGAVRATLPVPSLTNAEKAAFAAGIETARLALKRQVPGLTVDLHAALGTPEVVTARGSFLSGPSGAGPEAAVRAFLIAHAGLFGLAPAEVAALVTRAAYANPAGNLQWVTLEQRLNGLRVFRAEVRAAVTKAGEVAAIVSEVAAGVDASRLRKPLRTPGQAVVDAAANLGIPLAAPPALLESTSDGLRYTFERGPFTENVTVELVAFPLGPAQAVLAWRVLLRQAVPGYYVVVDDVTGQVLFRKNLTSEQSQTATFDVYGSDSPGPLSPSPVTPGTGVQGPAVGRSTFTFVSELPAADNLGWITDGTNVTKGNNADVRLGVGGVPGADVDGHAVGLCGGPSPACRNFVFAYTPPPGGTDPPSGTSSRLGALANAFFWANRYHDRLYSLGFTEAAGNYQTNNFGRGGLGGDAMVVVVQEPSFPPDSAAFFAAADGAVAGLALGLFTGPNPDRDPALDQHVVLHELTHGLSQRLIGNTDGLDRAQGLALGEGWSDFYALSLLAEPGDDPAGVYPYGAYVAFNWQGSGFTDNYFYGFRRFPYTTHTSLNPITFADIDPAQVNLTNGTYPPHLNPFPASEAHNAGEAWALMLWEARANVVAALGGSAGNTRMLQVVTDGMKLTPVNPAFTQARNAIMQADCAGFAGADEINLWRGFAKRGLGYSAVAPSGSLDPMTGTIEKFDLPLTVGAATINDAAGNGNGLIDPGETVAVTIPAFNGFYCRGLTGVAATLSTTSPGITVTQASGSYGSVAANATVSGTPYQIAVSANACGSAVNLTLAMTSAEGVTATRPVSLHVSTTCAGIHRDFNGDGKADILWRNTAGDVSMWLMNGPTVLSNSFVANVATNWAIGGAGDFNGDGKADILWRSATGDVSMWLMNGPTITSNVYIANVGTAWTVAAIADFNGDGKADILWRNTAGDLSMWLMNGPTLISNSFVASVATVWTVAGVGDFNADGRADVMWRNTGSGDASLWLMNGPSLTSIVVIGNVSLDWTVAGVGDFTGDGGADILWRNTGSGLLVMWTSLSSMPSVATVTTNWSVVKVGDFNGDGKVDILWRNTVGDLSMWLMNGPTVLSNSFVATVPLNWIAQ